MSYIIYRQSTTIARTLCTYAQQLSKTCLFVVIVADGNNLPRKKQTNEKRATSEAKFDALTELLISNEYIFDWKSEEGKQIDALAISHSISYALFRDVRDAVLKQHGELTSQIPRYINSNRFLEQKKIGMDHSSLKSQQSELGK